MSARLRGRTRHMVVLDDGEVFAVGSFPGASFVIRRREHGFAVEQMTGPWSVCTAPDLPVWAHNARGEP